MITLDVLNLNHSYKVSMVVNGTVEKVIFLSPAMYRDFINDVYSIDGYSEYIKLFNLYQDYIDKHAHDAWIS